MKYFELRDSFLIGHRQIDVEHAQLVAHLNSCIDISKIEANRADFCAKFSEFVNAVQKHIVNEETIMMEFGYMGAGADKEVHERGAKIFHELATDCQCGIHADIILKQAVNTLLDLMLKADLGFKGYLQEIEYQDA